MSAGLDEKWKGEEVTESINLKMVPDHSLFTENEVVDFDDNDD